MKAHFLKISCLTLLLLDIAVLVSSVMNPKDAAVGLREMKKGLYWRGSRKLLCFAVSGNRSPLGS